MMSTRTRWKAMMGRDPWEEIDPPSIADSVAARRVDANLPWDFFWARGVDGRALLTLLRTRCRVGTDRSTAEAARHRGDPGPAR